MLDLSPVQARRISDGDEPRMVPLRELHTGDTIDVRAGERIPVDGMVLAGMAMVDSALMTGESQPVSIGAGDPVVAGTLNVDGLLRIQVEAALGERRMDVLAGAVGRMLNAKSDLMNLADRVAAVLVPALAVSALLAFALAIAGGATWHDAFSPRSRGARGQLPLRVVSGGTAGGIDHPRLPRRDTACCCAIHPLWSWPAGSTPSCSTRPAP